MASTVYSTNIQLSSSVIGSLPLINPSPFGLGVYQWQTSSDFGLGSYICGIHLLAVVYILYIYIYIYVIIISHYKLLLHESEVKLRTSVNNNDILRVQWDITCLYPKGLSQSVLLCGIIVNGF